MTGDAGPAELPGQSRIPFSCCLEEHVRYSKPQSCASGDEWDDACHIPLFPPTRWTRKEVSSPIWAKGETDGLTGRNGTVRRTFFYKGILQNLES